MRYSTVSGVNYRIVYNNQFEPGEKGYVVQYVNTYQYCGEDEEDEFVIALPKDSPKENIYILINHWNSRGSWKYWLPAPE